MRLCEIWLFGRNLHIGTDRYTFDTYLLGSESAFFLHWAKLSDSYHNTTSLVVYLGHLYLFPMLTDPSLDQLIGSTITTCQRIQTVTLLTSWILCCRIFHSEILKQNQEYAFRWQIVTISISSAKIWAYTPFLCMKWTSCLGICIQPNKTSSTDSSSLGSRNTQKITAMAPFARWYFYTTREAAKIAILYYEIMNREHSTQNTQASDEW